MSNWPTEKLNDWVLAGDIELGRGDIISKEDIDTIPGPYPIYSSSAYNNGKFGEYAKFMFDEELVTWSVDGGGNLFYRPRHKFSVTNVCGFMRIKSGNLHALFVYYCLSEQHKHLTFDYTTKAHPSVIRKLYWLPRLEIHLQRKIARILQTIDQTIEKTEALIEKYQQIKVGLMHDLFTHGIDDDGKLRPSREQAPELYQETPIGRIPKEWEPKALIDMVHFQRGHDIVEAIFVEGKYPVISSGGIIGFHNEFTSKGPSVVIGRKGTIGKVHYVGSDFWAHDTSLYATNLFDNEPVFIYYLCNYLNLAKYGTKSGSPSLNRNDIHPLIVGKPSPIEQRKIVNRLNACDNKIDSVTNELEKLRHLKSGLMHDLLTGKVQVNIKQAEAAHV